MQDKGDSHGSPFATRQFGPLGTSARRQGLARHFGKPDAHLFKQSAAFERTSAAATAFRPNPDILIKDCLAIELLELTTEIIVKTCQKLSHGFAVDTLDIGTGVGHHLLRFL